MYPYRTPLNQYFVKSEKKRKFNSRKKSFCRRFWNLEKKRVKIVFPLEKIVNNMSHKMKRCMFFARSPCVLLKKFLFFFRSLHVTKSKKKNILEKKHVDYQG
jgi:hypothetical protein